MGREGEEAAEESDSEEGRWEASEIIPGLFLGSVDSARDLSAQAKHKIAFVLSVMDERPPPPACECRFIAMEDRADADLLRHLPAACDALATALATPGAAATCTWARPRWRWPMAQ